MSSQMSGRAAGVRRALKNTTASGGRVRLSEAGCPWEGTGDDSTPPMLPQPLPP